MRRVEIPGGWEESSVKLTELPRDEHGYRTISIEQIIKSRVTIPIHGNCEWCGKESPLPDESGLYFILRYMDGGRISFADAEDCEKERDRYPVPGWQRIDGDLICDSCFGDLKNLRDRCKKGKKG